MKNFVDLKKCTDNTSNINYNGENYEEIKMNNYIKFNENRWNNVNNDYTEPLTHEQLEELKNKPISVALTIGKKFRKNGLKKLTEKRY